MADGDKPQGFDNDPKEIVRLWRRQNPDFVCRCCGANDWQDGSFSRLDGDPPNDRVAGVLHYAEVETGRLLEAVPTIPMVCRNCGLTEIFASAAIFLRAQRDVKSDHE